MKSIYLSAVSLLLIPVVVFAQGAAYVTGLESELGEDTLTVRWNPVTIEDTSFYRVYYSFESIIENDGLYDDFEETVDDTPEYTFDPLPELDTIFVSVTAVDEDGEDIGFFVEEIEVDLTGEGGGDSGSEGGAEDDELIEGIEEDANENQSVSEEAIAIEEEREEVVEEENIIEEAIEEEAVLEVKEESFVLPESEEDIPEAVDPEYPTEPAPAVRLLTAVPASPTNLRVIFSGPVEVDAATAPQAFSIVDLQGNPLQIMRVTIAEEEVSIVTELQDRSKIYRFTAKEPLAGKGGVALDQARRTASFRGHANAPDSNKPADPTPVPTPEPEESTETTTPTPATPLTGVENLVVEHERQANGLYTVTTSWDLVGDASQLREYSVSQSRDGGASFGKTDTISGNVAGVTLRDTEPGSFTLAVTLVTIDGREIDGGQQTVQLGTPQVPTVTTTHTPTASVVTPPVSPVEAAESAGGLTDSGMATALSIAIGGGIVGWRRSRKKKVEDN